MRAVPRKVQGSGSSPNTSIPNITARHDLRVGEGREDVRGCRGEGADQEELARSIQET